MPERKCAFCEIRDNRMDSPEEGQKTPRPVKGKKFNYGFESLVFSETEKSMTLADRIPRSKAHMMIVPKSHKPTIEDIEISEWNDILKCLKVAIKKVNEVYKPEGFNIHSYNGREGFKFQSVNHFHLHIIPVYRKKYGHNWLVTRLKKIDDERKDPNLCPTPQEYQESLQELGEVVGEKSKVKAELVSQDKALIKGHIVIKPKKPIPNEIEAVDEQTWSQMGELLQECINKVKKIGSKNFLTHIGLNKLSGPKQENLSEFSVHLIPFPKEEYEYIIPDSSCREYKRVIRKLIDPDNPEYRISKKAEKERERESKIGWKPWVWGGAAAVGAFLFGIIVNVIWYRRKLRFKKRRY